MRYINRLFTLLYLLQATLPYIHSVTQTFTSVRSASHVVGNSVKTLREFQPKNYAIVSRDLAEN